MNIRLVLACLYGSIFFWSGLAYAASESVAQTNVTEIRTATDENIKDVFLAPGWGKLSF